MPADDPAEPTCGPHPARTRRRSLAASAVVLLVAAYAWWTVELAPFSVAATVAVLAAGVAAAGVGALRRRRPSRPARDAPGWERWTVLLGAAGAWQLAAYVQHPRHDHPTLSSLVNALLDSQPARAAAFVLWLAGAAALARR